MWCFCTCAYVCACEQIDSGFNKRVYSKNFLKTLLPKINRKAADPKLKDEVIYKIVTNNGSFIFY